jgi:hypothetical protein
MDSALPTALLQEAVGVFLALGWLAALLCLRTNALASLVSERLWPSSRQPSERQWALLDSRKREKILDDSGSG